MAYEPKRLNEGHKALVDMVLANPTATAKELGALLEYSEVYVQILMRTDSFREALATRREELIDPMLRETLQARIDALADVSVERLLEKLNKPVVSDKLVTDAVDIALRAKGFGARTPTVQVNQQFVAVMPAKAADAKEWAQNYAPADAPPMVQAEALPIAPPSEPPNA